jgi:hypothetical protein
MSSLKLLVHPRATPYAPDAPFRSLTSTLQAMYHPRVRVCALPSLGHAPLRPLEKINLNSESERRVRTTEG